MTNMDDMNKTDSQTFLRCGMNLTVLLLVVAMLISVTLM